MDRDSRGHGPRVLLYRTHHLVDGGAHLHLHYHQPVRRCPRRRGGTRRTPGRECRGQQQPMKVTHFDVFPVQAGWRTWVFIRLRTDDGVEGWGEATTVFADAAVLGALEDLREFVIGIDPTRIEEFWSNRFYRTIFHGPTFYSAVASVEHALWDITGKSLDVPVRQLIDGPIRDHARLYANTWFLGARTPGEYAAKAAAVLADGWDALKFDPLPGSLIAATRQELQAAGDRVAAVRYA